MHNLKPTTCSLLLLALAIGSCNGQQKKGVVYYEAHNGGGLGTSKILIPEADSATFRKLNAKDYAVDKNHVFWKAGVLEDADPKTFINLNNWYGKDKHFAYYLSQKIDGADGKTFEVFGNGPYSHDAKDCFFEIDKLDVPNVKEFKVFPPNRELMYWAMDESNLYILANKYPIADCKSFEFLTGGYERDNINIYWDGELVKGADRATFKVTGFARAEDKNFKYVRHKKQK